MTHRNSSRPASIRHARQSLDARSSLPSEGIGGRRTTGLGEAKVEIGDRVMDREVKTPRGLQPLRDPLASPYWPVARRVLGEYPTQNRFRRRANRPRYDEGEESLAANSSCAPRGARRRGLLRETPSRGGAQILTSTTAGSPPSSANRKRLRSMPPRKPVRLPSAPMTRWQGTMTGIALRPFAAPPAARRSWRRSRHKNTFRRTGSSRARARPAFGSRCRRARAAGRMSCRVQRNTRRVAYASHR